MKAKGKNRLVTWLKQQLNDYRHDIDYKSEFIQIDIREQIAEVMKKREITKTALAKKMGRSNAYITKLLDGNDSLTIKK